MDRVLEMHSVGINDRVMGKAKEKERECEGLQVRRKKMGGRRIRER